MLYAKIDDNGSVVVFPYVFNDILQVPADAVKVDTQTLKPKHNWDEKLLIDQLIKNDQNEYLVSYKVLPKFDTLEQKQEAIRILKSQYEKQNLDEFQTRVNILKQGYSDDEIFSWDMQVKEAQQFLDGVDMSNSLIQQIAQKRGIELKELASRILQKRALFTIAYGNFLGQFQHNTDILDSIDLNNETTYHNIDKYGWST